MSFEAFAVVRVPFPFTEQTTTKNRPALILSSAPLFNRPAGHSVMAMITSAANAPWPLDCPIEDLAAAGGRGINKEKAAIERERLFGILEWLVLWENTNNETVLREAREEIWKSWRETCALNKNHPQAAELLNPDKLPAFHDPFAGGGALPLEAQRLGLESYASELNPVAVTINKAMIEIPPKFAGRKPVGPFAAGREAKRRHA
ncbi:MAG: hypothetical protein PHE55_00530 [Methylococcaceae bacterium]|nr:hypothetical protein [Methylococcaceae bacterium]